MTDSTFVTHQTYLFPSPTNRQSLLAAAPSATGDSFSVDAQGNGSLTGLAYTIPAHTKGEVKVKLQTPALTSQNMADLNSLILSMLSASVKTQVHDYEATHASANCSFYAFWSAGGSASYDKTHESMTSSGLTDEQITIIIQKMTDLASQMSAVELDLEIDNTANDYDVTGNLLLYTISGTISTSKGTFQYRMLADQGTAGSGNSTAPSTVNTIPLN